MRRFAPCRSCPVVPVVCFLLFMLLTPCPARLAAQTAADAAATAASGPKAVVLTDIPWTEAEKRLTADSIIVFASGNASKAHGPHLPLSTDFLQAEYVLQRVMEQAKVVVAPSLHYGYYPPFVEYPGSTTLPLTLARDLVIDICRSYARNTPVRRFYAISHGAITRPVFEQAASRLEKEGILLRYTDWEGAKEAGVKAVSTQEKGSHADEVETSILLHIAPEMVNMKLAVKELGSDEKGRMIGNHPQGIGVYSPSGVFGDPTIATAAKGQRIIGGVVETVLKDIEKLRGTPLPMAEPLGTLFAAVEGKYELGSAGSIAVRREGALLAVERPGKPKLLLQHAGNHRFGLWTVEARFLSDDRGAVTHLLLSEGGRERIARKVAD